MKNLLVILLLISTNCYSQSVVKFVDAKTKMPVSALYVEILMNQNTLINNMMSNEQGFITIRIPNITPNSDYELSVNNQKYNYVLKSIDLKNKDTLIVKMKRDNYFVENSSNLFSSVCGTISFFNYKPKIIKSLNDLPKSIAVKLKAYFKKRVGSKLAKNFELTEGQRIDLNELKKRIPNANYKSSYYLCFAYRNLASGISMYSSKIELDENGKVLKDIDFPVIKNNQSFQIIPFEDIKKKAKELGYYKEGKTKISITYIKENNELVWKFTNESTINSYQIQREEILFDIQSGEYLRTDSRKLIYVN